ncbi:hypothetical protein R3P38DRAFT_3284362 [Favolaschia claudopus]|uniref:Uncharacterized protein n=1 Tax=Favolaschia claudopus TaxID=2862362 RepID=A0AAW0A6T1_9AGAR
MTARCFLSFHCAAKCGQRRRTYKYGPQNARSKHKSSPIFSPLRRFLRYYTQSYISLSNHLHSWTHSLPFSLPSPTSPLSPSNRPPRSQATRSFLKSSPVSISTRARGPVGRALLHECFYDCDLESPFSIVTIDDPSHIPYPYTIHSAYPQTVSIHLSRHVRRYHDLPLHPDFCHSPIRLTVVAPSSSMYHMYRPSIP